MRKTRLTTRILVVLPVAFALLAGSERALAQTTATIAGIVTDETGGVLPGAEVIVSNEETGVSRATVSDEQGRYRVTNLNIGLYDVSASLSGFQTAARRGIALTIGREAVVDITLNIGELSDQVTVTSDAPLVDTRSAGLGGIVDRDTILQIPLNGRDLTGLITMQAGTTEIASSNVNTHATAGFGRRFSIGGARPTDNAVLLDGTDVRSLDQSVPAGVSGAFLGGEAIQEFKVERNSYSAQFGGSSGGVINVASKAGTNAFHGSLYGFFRDDALDAAPFRAPIRRDASGNVVGKEEPDFQRQQYGASVGGRIIRNRTFYFGNYEGLRDRLGYTGFLRTFTPAAREGIFSNRTVQVKPEVIPYLELWPMPGPTAVDLGDGTAREATSLKRETDEKFGQLRIDHNFSDSDAVFGRFTRQISDLRAPGAGGVGSGADVIERWAHVNRVYNTFVTVEERKIFSSGMLNTVRFGYNRRGISETSIEDPPVNPALFHVPPDKWRYPMGAPPIMGGISVAGVSSVGLGRGWVDRVTNNLQFIDDLVYSRGAHNWKFGVNWLNTQFEGDNPSRPGGELSFNSIDNFLLGRPNSFRGDILPETDHARDLRWNVIGWYVQDDWLLTPRLTINAGFRHEFYTVPTETDGKFANLRDPLNDTEITILGTRGDDWWENNSLTSFQPRVGLAWDPTGSGKTAVRAGGGIFYNHLTAQWFSAAAWRTAPFALESNVQTLPGVMPFPGIYDYIVGLGAGQADLQLFAYDDMRNPHMIQWNLNVQHEVLPQTGVTVGYAGSRGLNMLQSVSRNTARADLIDGRYVFPLNAARPNPAFPIDLTTREATADSWYHSLQVEMQRRFSGGWMLQTSYTYSRTIDEVSQTQTLFAGEGGTPYYWDPDLNRGLAPYHLGNRFSATGVWMLPFGAGQRFGGDWSGWTEKLLGGWQIGGQLVISDGGPLTIVRGTPAALSALGVGANRPDLVPGGNSNPVIGDPDRYFDASQFVMPPARTLGNLGRNTLIGPGLATVDLGLTKNTMVSSQARLQIRVEFFNLLNRVNLGNPDRTVFNAAGVINPNAGFIESTSTTARQIQLGVRLEW
jgi:outer membrane receptor protein involved in Fe transport